MVNYSKELKIGVDIRRKKKVEKTTEFAERIKKIQKKVGAVLKKAKKKMKRQADKRRKEIEEQKKEDKVVLSTKDLVFKKRLANKLVD